MSGPTNDLAGASIASADMAWNVTVVPGETAFALGGSGPVNVAAASSPHIHPDILQIILAMTGECLVTIDQKTELVRAPCLVTIAGGGVHSFKVQGDAAGWAATIANHRILELVVSRGLDLGFLLRMPHLVDLANDSPALDALAELMRILVAEFADSQDGRQAALDGLHQLILIHVTRMIRQGTGADNPGKDRERELFLAFRRLVEQRFLFDRTLSGYLRELRCGAARLNRVCRRFAGLSAKAVILDRLTDEARRRLAFTTASAAEIGYALGFAEPSYFVRFFRQRSGMTPGQYRRHASS